MGSFCVTLNRNKLFSSDLYISLQEKKNYDDEVKAHLTFQAKVQQEKVGRESFETAPRVQVFSAVFVRH